MTLVDLWIIEQGCRRIFPRCKLGKQLLICFE